MFACPYIKLLKLVCVLTCKDLRLARCACWQRGYTIGTVGKVTAVGLLVQCSYSVLKIINILFFIRTKLHFGSDNYLHHVR